MLNSFSLMSREKKTIEIMIRLYCHDRHATKSSLCKYCEELLDYAGARLAKCPFQNGKPTCAKCAIHCYSPIMREKVREVMCYAGPRMSYRHPILALLHLLDGRRKPAFRI
jgi:hypothetical protein